MANNGRKVWYATEQQYNELEARVRELEKKVSGLEKSIDVLKSAVESSAKNNNSGQLDLTTLLVLSKL